jgi:acyl-CoA reductase-like NAD-dependent aldehyde dehydrogenase
MQLEPSELGQAEKAVAVVVAGAAVAVAVAAAASGAAVVLKPAEATQMHHEMNCRLKERAQNDSLQNVWR